MRYDEWSKDRTGHLQNDSLLEQEEHLQDDSLLQHEEQQMCTKIEEQDTLNSTHTHSQWKLGHRKPINLTAVSFSAYGERRFDSCEAFSTQ